MVKNPPANAGDVGLIPESGRSPGGGNGNPLQGSWVENSVDRGVHGGLQSMGHTSYPFRAVTYLNCSYNCLNGGKVPKVVFPTLEKLKFP